MNPNPIRYLVLPLLVVTLRSGTLQMLGSDTSLDSRIAEYAAKLKIQLKNAGLDTASAEVKEAFVRGVLADPFTSDSSFARGVVENVLGKKQPSAPSAVEANRIQTLLDAGERNRLSSVDEESWGRLSKQLFPKLSEAQRQLLVEGTVAAAKTAEAREELQQEGFKPGTFEYAVQLKKLGGGEAVSAGESPKTNFNVGAYPRSFFTFGVRSVSPFKVDPTNHALIRSSSDTRGYVEYVFNNHWAFTTSEDDVWADDRVKWFGPKPKNATKIAKSLNHGDWFLNRFDTEFRTGFTFAGDKATAATITGSGDFYVDGAVGFRWYQIASKDLRMSFGPEAAGGMSTDFSNIQVHPHGLLGAAWHIGLNPFLGAVPERRAAITFRAGYGFVDAPELTLVSVPASGGAKKDVLGVVVENDRIKYHSMAGGPAVEADMVYPLSKSSFLVAGGRIFKTANFDQWSFHIGYVLSLDKVAAAFGAAVD